jgi:hypothetical protein
MRKPNYAALNPCLLADKSLSILFNHASLMAFTLR